MGNEWTADKPQRPAVRHLTYHGDCRDAVGQVMGPNTLNEWLLVVEASYDKRADRTRLGFAYLPHTELGDVQRDEHGQLWLKQEAKP